MWVQQIGIVGLKCKAKSFPSKNRRQEASFDQIRRIYSVLATFETLHLKVTYWSIFEFCYQKVEKILFVKRAGLPPSGGGSSFARPSFNKCFWAKSFFRFFSS